MATPKLERCDSYEDQLRLLFISCDVDGGEALSELELRSLCAKLELAPPQSRSLIRQLLNDPETLRRRDNRVSFEVFKEGLVEFLERGDFNAVQNDEVATPQRPKSPPRQVEPKFVFGDRRYGRRSRPGSVDVSEDEDENGDADAKRNNPEDENDCDGALPSKSTSRQNST